MSTLRTDGSGSNGVHNYRRLLTEHMEYIDCLVRTRRRAVPGVPPEDVANETVLWLLEKEKHYKSESEAEFWRWVAFAVRRVVAGLMKTRGWSANEKRNQFRSQFIPAHQCVSETHLGDLAGRQRDVSEPEPQPVSRKRVRRAILRLAPSHRRAVLVAFWRSPENLKQYDRDAGNRRNFTSEKLTLAKRRLRALLAG